MLKISYDPKTNEINIISTPQALWSIGECVAIGGKFFAGAVSPKAHEAKAPEAVKPGPAVKSGPAAKPAHPDALAVTRFIRDWKRLKNTNPTYGDIKSGLNWSSMRVNRSISLAASSNLMRVKAGGHNRRNSYDINTAALGAK